MQSPPNSLNPEKIIEIVEATAPQHKELLFQVVSILKNIVEHEGNEKYRRVKLCNQKFSNMRANIPDVMAILEMAGFLTDDEAVFLPMNAEIARVKETKNALELILETTSTTKQKKSPSENSVVQKKKLSVDPLFQSIEEVVGSSDSKTYNEWKALMGMGNQTFYTSFALSSKSFEEAVELATSFYNSLDKEDPRRFHAGLMCASAYAALSESHIRTTKDQQKEFATLAMNYIDEKVVNSRIDKHPMFHEEIHLALSEVFRAVSEIVEPMDLVNADSGFELAYTHAQLSPSDVRLVQIHLISCFAMKYYSSLLKNNFDVRTMYEKWGLIHEKVKIMHGMR